MEDIKWIIESADKLSIVGYLALTFFLFGLALHREWIVMGGQYRNVCKDRDRYRTERDELRHDAEDRARRIETKLEIYAEAERLSRSASARRRMRASGSN